MLTAVDVEELDALDDTDEDELLRGMDFRGIKTPLTSSEFIEFRDWPPPPLIPHAGRLMFEKLGGLATAVMRKDWSGCSVGRCEWTDAGVAMCVFPGAAGVWTGPNLTPPCMGRGR